MSVELFLGALLNNIDYDKMINMLQFIWIHYLIKQYDHEYNTHTGVSHLIVGLYVFYNNRQYVTRLLLYTLMIQEFFICNLNSRNAQTCYWN